MAKEKVEEYTITITELREGGESVTYTIPKLLDWMRERAAAEKAEKMATSSPPVEEKEKLKIKRRTKMKRISVFLIFIALVVFISTTTAQESTTPQDEVIRGAKLSIINSLLALVGTPDLDKVIDFLRGITSKHPQGIVVFHYLEIRIPVDCIPSTDYYQDVALTDEVIIEENGRMSFHKAGLIMTVTVPAHSEDKNLKAFNIIRVMVPKEGFRLKDGQKLYIRDGGQTIAIIPLKLDPTFLITPYTLEGLNRTWEGR